MSMMIKIDNEDHEVVGVCKPMYTSPALPCIKLDDYTQWYVAADSETAGEIVREYWEYMRKNNKGEFIALIGKERLLQWAVNDSDTYGCHSFEEFLDLVAKYPEQRFGTRDNKEYDCAAIPDEGIEDIEDSELVQELGFTPTVAYRAN